MLRFILLILCLPTLSSEAQEMRFFKLVKYSPANGLAGINIRSIAQDFEGQVWISTQSGASCFDGQQFTNFSTNNPGRQFISGPDIRNAIADGNLIHVLSTTHGISTIDISTKTVLSNTITFDKSNGNYAFQALKYGNSFYTATMHGLYEFADGKIKKLLEEYRGPINSLYITGDTLALGAENFGLLFYSLSQKKQVGSIPFHQQKRFRTTAIVKHANRLLATTSLGLFEIKGNVATLIDSTVSSMAVYDENKMLYAGTRGLWLSGYPYKPYLQLADFAEGGQPTPFSHITCLFTDRNKNIWIGFSDGLGLIRKIAWSYQAFPAVHGFEPLGHLYSIFKDKSILVLGGSNALYVKNDSLNQYKTFENTGLVGGINKINGHILASTAKGLKILEGSTLQPISSRFTYWKPFEQIPFNSMVQLAKDSAIFASMNNTGLYLWNKQQAYVKPIQITGVTNNLNAITRLKSGRFMLLTESEVALLDKNLSLLKHLKNTDNRRLKDATFFDALEINDSYYVSAYGCGIVQLNKDLVPTKFITAENGLIDNGVYSLLPAGDSSFIISGNNGLFLYHTGNGQMLHRTIEDGLHTSTFEEAAAFKYGPSYLFGGVNGFTEFAASDFTSYKDSFKCYISGITLSNRHQTFDTADLHLKRFEVPNNYSQAILNFSVIDYQNPGSHHFYYKINDEGNNWIHNGTNPRLSFAAMPPGTYNIQVKAENQDKLSSSISTLTLVFLPKWYQTLAFKIAILLSILGGIYMLYNFRIRQLKKVFAVRQRISRDLHDDIGSTLSTIKMYSEAAKTENSGAIIGQIEANTKDVIEKLDDIVWANNPKNDSLDELCHRIESFARPLLRSKAIHFNFDCSHRGQSLQISSLTRQAVFLIFKEAINNAVKYADCTVIDAEIILQQQKINASIQDNGIGFNTALPTHRNGLLNMRQRVADLNGKIDISSTPGEGSRISLTVPV